MILILANSATERRDIVARWNAQGLDCQAAASGAEAAAKAADIEGAHAIVFIDSLDFIALMAWSDLVASARTEPITRILITNRLHRREVEALEPHYEAIVHSEEQALTLLGANEREAMHVRRASEFPELLLSLGEAVRSEVLAEASVSERQTEPVFSQSREARIDAEEGTSAAPRAEAGEPNQNARSGRWLLRMWETARAGGHARMLDVPEDATREQWQAAAEELRATLLEYASDHMLSEIESELIYGIHVAIAEALYLRRERAASERR